MKWFQRSIRNKLTALVLLAIVPSVLLASVLFAWREGDRRLQSKQRELAGIAAALAANVSEPFGTGNRRHVANALKGIGAIRDITHVGVKDLSGTPIFDFGSGILVGKSQTTSGDSFESYRIDVPIRNGGREVGTLTLIADISELQVARVRSLISAVFAGLLSMLAGLIVSQRLQRAIAAPIIELTQAMRMVGETKEFSGRVIRSTEDETGALVDSFNRMLQEISVRDRALSQYNQCLEDQVEKRTCELAAATQNAERANAAKSEFLATMSHEIRTPMNGMMVMTELLAAGNLEPRERRRCEVILRSGKTLLAILNDILDLSKIESGNLTLEAVVVEPSKIIDDVLDLFSERARSKGLELASYVAPEVPETIEADPVRLSQILSNLVNNALKFTEAGGVLVRLECREGASNAIRFSVADSGIGIAPEKLQTIFAPFTQAEQSTTRRYGGTGIGLTISRRLVQAMGGSLGVESTEGLGSVFSFEIPATGALGSEQCVRQTSGRVLLAIPAGPVRDSLSAIAHDVGLDVVIENDSVEIENRESNIRFAIVTSAIDNAALDALARHSVPVVATSYFGDAAIQKLTNEGHLWGTLELPLSARRARASIQQLLNGSKHVNRLPSAQPSSGVCATNIYPGKRVLAADDSELNREVLMESLGRLGVDVTFVENGGAAVEAAMSSRFDLIFMDGSMPVMDGFAATRAIRDLETQQHRTPVPIVGLSAHVFSDPREWQQCGMSGFITKPFTLAAIRKCLDRWLTAEGGAPCTAKTRETGNITAIETPDDLLDLEVLEGLRVMQSPGGDLVSRVIQLYQMHGPEALKALSDAISSGTSNEAIAAAAHALKSLSRNVGALRVGDLCGELEQSASMTASDVDRSALLTAIDVTLRATLDALEAVRTSNRASISPDQIKPDERGAA